MSKIKVYFPKTNYSTLYGPAPEDIVFEAQSYDLGATGDVGGIDPDRIYLPEPVNKDHPFAEQLLAKWQVLKSWSGGRKLYDLKGKYRVSLQTASTTYPSWKSTVRPGGMGELVFDGSQTYVDCGQILGFSAEPFAISAWVKLSTNVANFKAIAGRGYLATAVGYGLYVDSSNFPVFQVRNGATLSAATGGTAFSLGAWHHMLGVRSGGVTKLYVDGQLAASDSTAVTISSDTSKFEIGARDSTGPGFFFPGSIDDVSVYQRSFSAQQAFNLFTELRDGSPGLLNRVKTHFTALSTITHNNYNETGSGGALGGGSATPQVNYNPSTSGGALAGGSGSTSGNNYSDTGSGGALMGGSATLGGMDGLLGGGSAINNIISSEVASSGVLVGGSAYLDPTLIKAVSGGILIGGSPTWGTYFGSHSLVYVTDSAGNALPFEIVHWEPTTGQIYLAVKDDLKTAQDNLIYVYYGWEK